MEGVCVMNWRGVNSSGGRVCHELEGGSIQVEGVHEMNWRGVNQVEGGVS